MNSLFIAFSSLVLFFLAYRFYVPKLERLWRLNPERPTPAVSKSDGIDYVPARHWSILFGHHFASIAGAGPIIGPVIAAALFGWLPAVIWIVLGSIFIGGVHDFSSLMLSVRHGGSSVPEIGGEIIGRRTRLVFSIFVWLALVLVVAVFAAVTAKTLVEEPKIVIPTFGLILVAILVGMMIYRWRMSQVLSTIIGVGLLIGLLFLGYQFPVYLGPKAAISVWIVILLIYAYIASCLPVNILLQPRDYLSSFILFFGLGLGYLGLFFTHPVMHAPAFIGWNSQKGALWPFLCVIIACGAISGFHGLIAGGTTSKQLSNERYSQRIGYGGMLLEACLSILALVCVSAGLYWYGEKVKTGLIYPELIKGGNWIVTFGKGYGELVSPLIGSAFGAMVAMVVLNSFVMTTLDSATRINRYITEELLGRKIRLFKNRFISSLLVIGIAAYLALGSWKLIWPVFGATNQLVATLILLIVSVWLIRNKSNCLYAFIPAVFMFLTTVTALIWQGIDFYKLDSYLLSFIAWVAVILAFVMSYDCLRKICKLKSSCRNTGGAP